MQCSQGGCRNLGGKIVCLAFSESQQSLCLLEDDFQGSSLSIDFICAEEVKSSVSGYQTIPSGILTSLDEKQTNLSVCKDHISYHIIATQLSIVFTPFPFGEQLYQSRCRKVFALKMIFRSSVLTDFNHAQVVTFHVAGTNKANNILACKPIVSQNIPEFHAFTYGSFYHVNHKTDFACRIFVDSFLQGILFVTGLGEAVFEFLGGHTKISFSPFFTKKCKIENHLGCSVCYGQKQCLESQNASVLNMGMHPADILEAASGFGIVRIINYQTGGVFLMLGADFDFRPKLHVKMIDKFTPINLRVAHKTIEHIFFAVQQAA